MPRIIFRLDDGCEVVLVVDKILHGFDKSIARYLEDSILDSYSRKQIWSSKYEFMMKIGAFSIHDQVLKVSLYETKQVFRYNQGGELTLISTQYMGLKYLV